MVPTMVLEVPCGMNEAGERYCRSAGRQRHFRPQAEFEAEGFAVLGAGGGGGGGVKSMSFRRASLLYSSARAPKVVADGEA